MMRQQINEALEECKIQRRLCDKLKPSSQLLPENIDHRKDLWDARIEAFKEALRIVERGSWQIERAVREALT